MATICNISSARKALALAAQGLAVFPCGQDKAPLTPHGYLNASRDERIICDWFARSPNALIGIPTGEKFCVVDCDLQHVEAQHWYGEHCRYLPLTRKHTTRSGGRHLLLQPNDAVKCTTGKIHPHIDTRGRGGFIVWWPAIGFEVLHGNVLAPVPEFILRALAREPVHQLVAPRRIDTRAKARRKLDGVLRTIARAPEGERNTVTFWGANRLLEMARAGLMTCDDAIALTVEAAARNGLSRHEAFKTARSALRGNQ